VGWLLVLAATWMINHFELFGLQQVIRYYRGQSDQTIKFQEPYLYKYVRHPLYVGWFLTFWAIPTMTVGHLFFAAVASGYILVAIQFEERDLRHFHSEYADYSRRVPMLIPGLSRLLGRDRSAPR
jgi:protein-S-isoprenylcysteine O-methyltransferase Ste14